MYLLQCNKINFSQSHYLILDIPEKLVSYHYEKIIAFANLVSQENHQSNEHPDNFVRLVKCRNNLKSLTNHKYSGVLSSDEKIS